MTRAFFQWTALLVAGVSAFLLLAFCWEVDWKLAVGILLALAVKLLGVIGEEL